MTRSCPGLYRDLTAARPLTTKAMVMGTGPAPTLPPPPKKPKP